MTKTMKVITKHTVVVVVVVVVVLVVAVVVVVVVVVVVIQVYRKTWKLITTHTHTSTKNVYTYVL